MNLTRFPRRRYADGPTPLQPMPRLSRMLGGPELYIKRDDLLGFAAGGNKIRKLEFVMADALAAGADTVITCGAVQSNHCRLTLAAAVREGLKCGLVLEERVAGGYQPHASGNNFLYRLMGVGRLKVVPGGSDMAAAMQAMAKEVEAAGGAAVPDSRWGVHPARRVGLCGVRAGNRLAVLRARGADRPGGVRERQCRHARGAARGLLGDQQRDPGCRHEREPSQAAAGGAGIQTGAGDRGARGHPRRGSARSGPVLRGLRRGGVLGAHGRDGGGGQDAGAHRGRAARPGLHRQGHGRPDRSGAQGVSSRKGRTCSSCTRGARPHSMPTWTASGRHSPNHQR